MRCTHAAELGESARNCVTGRLGRMLSNAMGWDTPADRPSPQAPNTEDATVPKTVVPPSKINAATG